MIPKIQSTVENITIEVKDVAKKVTIVQKKNKGLVRLTYWGKNKKTKQLKLQVCNITGNDKVFVAIFSEKIMKCFVDKALRVHFIKH